MTQAVNENTLICFQPVSGCWETKVTGKRNTSKKNNRKKQPYTGRVSPRLHAVTEKNSLNLFC